MSRDIRRYWQEVRAIQAGLPEFVWLVAGESAPVQTPADLAARLLHAKSHRLATEEETAALGVIDHAKKREAQRGQLRRQGVALVPMPK